MYSPVERRFLIVSLVLLDVSVLLLAVWLAGLITVQTGRAPFSVPWDARSYVPAGAVLVLVWLLLFAALRLYDPTILLVGALEYARVVRACAYGALALIAGGFFLRDVLVVFRFWLLALWGLTTILVGSARFLFRRMAYWLRRERGLFVIRVLIVGANEQGKALARQWSRAPGFEVVGFLDDFLPQGSAVGPDLQVLGPPRFLARVATEAAVDEVIVVPNAIAWETFEEIMTQSTGPDGLSVKLAPGFYETTAAGVDVITRGFVPLLEVRQARITGTDAILKGLLDYVGVGLVLLLSVPLVVVVSMALKVTGPRSRLLSAHRVYGFGGILVTTYTFDVTATDGDGSVGARLRRFLRRSGLYKMPQLVSVVLGRMSLVGPRAISEAEASRFQRWLPGLLTVRPGVTGLWAVGGQPSLDDEIRAMMYYVRNWTIWLDLQVLFHTLRRGVRGGERREALVPIEGVGVDGLPRLDPEQDTRERGSGRP